MDSSNYVDHVEDVDMTINSQSMTTSLEVTGVTSHAPINPGTQDSVVPDAVSDDVNHPVGQAPPTSGGHDPELVEQWATQINNRVATCEVKIANLEDKVQELDDMVAVLRRDTRDETLAKRTRASVQEQLHDRVMPLEQRVATLERTHDDTVVQLSSMKISEAPVARSAAQATRTGPPSKSRTSTRKDEVPGQSPSRATRASKKSSRSQPKSARRSKSRDDPSSSDPSSSSSSSSSSSDTDSTDEESQSSQGRSRRHRRGRTERRNRRRRNERASATRTVGGETKSLGRDNEEDLVLGPSHEGVITLTSTNPRYKTLMNYRYYRLARTKQERSSYEVGKVHSKASKIETALGRKFSGSDPIRIFSALRDIVQEANSNKVTEGQLFLAVPRLLTGHAKKHFESSRNGSRRGAEALASWPETVNFLLTAYATPRVISKALDDLREVKQEKDETEFQFSDRVNEAMSRCGGVHTSDEKTTHFVEHLLPSISPIVAQRREEKPDMTYYELVRYAMMIGEAERARGETRRSVKGTSSELKKKRKTKSSSKTLVLDEGKKKKKKRSTRSRSSTPSDSVGSSASHLVVAGSARSSSSEDEHGSSSSSGSETSSSDEEEEALPMEPRFIPSAKVAFDVRRRGWQDAGPPRRNGSPARGPPRGHAPPVLRAPGAEKEGPRTVVCHTCYEKGHYAPDCDNPPDGYLKVIRNYSELKPHQLAWVPRISFDNAVAQIQKASKTESQEPPSEAKN